MVILPGNIHHLLRLLMVSETFTACVISCWSMGGRGTRLSCWHQIGHHILINFAHNYYSLSRKNYRSGMAHHIQKDFEIPLFCGSNWLASIKKAYAHCSSATLPWIKNLFLTSNITIWSFLGMIKHGAPHSEWFTFLSTPILTKRSTSALSQAS